MNLVWLTSIFISGAAVACGGTAAGDPGPPSRTLATKPRPANFRARARSAIVNVGRIESLRPASHGERDLVLRDGTQLKLSRMYRDRIAGLL